MSSETTFSIVNKCISEAFANGTKYTKSYASVTLNLIFPLAISNTYDTGILAFLDSSDTTYCKIALCNDQTHTIEQKKIAWFNQKWPNSG